MKTTITIVLLTITIGLNAQCYENFASGSIGYVIPKGVSIEGNYTTKIGFTGGIGVGYQVPKTYKLHKPGSQLPTDSIGNMIDLYSYVGWRLFMKPYVISVYANAGVIMGDAEKMQPLTSIKILFPTGLNAISVEPVYIFGRGMTGRISYHFKL